MLDPAEGEPVPWSNGAGSTREVAVRTADGEVLWRVSVADLTGEAAFSAFPGLDRVFVPLGPVDLTIQGVTRTVAPGESVRFPGEAPVSLRPHAPTRALNLMTRRGELHGAVALRRPEGATLPGAEVSVLLGALVADVRLMKDTR